MKAKYISLFLLSLALLVNESFAQSQTVTVNASNVMVFPTPDAFRLSNPVAIGTKYYADTASLIASTADFFGQTQISADGAIAFCGNRLNSTPPVTVLNVFVNLQGGLNVAGETDLNRVIVSGLGITFGTNVTASQNVLIANTASPRLDIKTGDNAGYAPVNSLYHRVYNGAPEGAVTAPVGTILSNPSGGAGSAVYIKETGTGNTGWRAL